ncbi:hypothetical protein PI125_g3669 [Phytophthora idaei]|nr:hypothetical protein PI125_g3669 [Phytophthora idaei]
MAFNAGRELCSARDSSTPGCRSDERRNGALAAVMTRVLPGKQVQDKLPL